MRLLRKHLASSTSIAVLLLAAGEAHATTDKTIGKLYSLGNIVEPLIQSTDYGAMGAEFDASDEINSDTNGNMSQMISAGASAWVLGSEYPLIKFDVTASGSASSGAASVTTTLLGQTAGTTNYGTLSASVGFCTTQKGPDTQMMIGPIPVTFELDAGLCPSLTLSGSASASNGTTTFTFTGTPDINVGATGYLGIGTEVASAGIKGSLTLLDVQTPIQNTLVLSGSGLNDSTTGTVSITFLAGELDLYAKAGWGVASIEYDYQLCSWPGFNWTFVGFSDEHPTATHLSLSIGAGSSGGVATGSYVYAGPTENNSYYWIERADDATGTNEMQVAEGYESSDSIQYALSPADSGKFLQFCVIPTSYAGSGGQACSAWYSVGPLVELYRDDGYAGAQYLFPYKLQQNGTCFNLPDYGFNDALSSYHFEYDAGMSKASIALYWDAGCSGAVEVQGVTGNSSAGSIDTSSINATFGTNWNDQVSSFRVVWNDNVTASNIAVSFTGPSVSPSYTYYDATGLAEAGTTFEWLRADDSVGTNATVVAGYGTTAGYTFAASDEGKYLEVCVKASNGVVTGDESCSGWTYVGKLLTLYKDANYAGTTLRFPYERWGSGTCVSLGAYGFNDAMTSYSVDYDAYVQPPNDNNSYGVVFYWDTACSGNTLTSGFGTAGGTNAVSSVGGTWNDQASSFRINYRHVEARDPAVIWSGPAAQPVYTYFNSMGVAESGTTYEWQRSKDATGTNPKTVQAYSATKAYAITPNDASKYLRVCIKPSDGIMTGNEVCSAWGSVGMLVTIYSQPDSAGTQTSFAYEHLNSQCLVLANYGVTTGAVSAVWGSERYNQPGSDTTSYGTTLYQSADCTVSDQDGTDLLWMAWNTTGTDSKASIGIGSTVQSLRINYPHFNDSPW